MKKKPDIIEETLPDGKTRLKLRTWKEQFFPCRDKTNMEELKKGQKFVSIDEILGKRERL